MPSSSEFLLKPFFFNPRTDALNYWLLELMSNSRLFSHSELARHRDLGLDSNQVGVHAPEEREDGNQEVREVEDYVDTGQQGMTSTKPDVKRGNTSLTMLRGSPPPRASLQNTSLASRRPSQLLNDPQQSSQRLAQNTLAAVRRLVVSCDNCEEEFESFQEKSSHICNYARNGAEELSGPPSISLLAARSPSPSQDVELPNDIGTEGQNNAEQSEGEIIEGHSEVAGPSGVSGEGAVPITPPSSPPDPIRAIAEKDSEELQLELDIDPSVLCTKLRVRVPLGRDKDDNSLPLSISAAYTSAAGSKQKSITDYFGGGKGSQQSKEVEEDSLTRSGFEKVVERAKKKGFLAPSYASLEEKENKGGNRRQQKVPFYKLMKDTNLAVDAFNYGSIPGVSNYLLSHFHYDHYIGMSRKWAGRVVCSSATARLAMSKFKLPESLFLTIEPEEERVVDGVLVTALDANHCPGSLMFVLRFDAISLSHQL